MINERELARKGALLLSLLAFTIKTENRGTLIGGGRNKTENQPELGCR
jgi:hypothetical protein